MSSQGTAAALSALTAASEWIAMTSGNISNEQTDGYKSFSQVLGANAGPNGASSAGVAQFVRLNTDIQGSITDTGVSTDIMIDGAGMFVVSDPTNGAAGNSIYFSKNGSFRTNNAGQLSLASGQLLMAWQLDNNGKLPPGASTTASLSPVSIQQLVSQATATSTVDFAVNLDSTAQVAGSGEITLAIKNTGSNASPYNSFLTSSAILYPDTTNSLTAGEGISVTVPILQSDGTMKQTTTNFTYGGFVESPSFTDTGTTLVTGGSNASTDSITITVGSNVATLTRGTGTTNLQVLDNLVNQINSSYNTFLTARVVDNGTSSVLLVAPIDATQAMSFSGTGTLQTELNFLTNTVAASNRFASVANLATMLNTVSGVTATAGSGLDQSITIRSTNSLYLNNYQPLGDGSNFLGEFNTSVGYIPSSYNPYDVTNNMANGAFTPNYSKDVVVYDAMGNAYDFMMSFLKTNVNTWSVEIYSLNPTAINNGRTDGLVQAGNLVFSNTGQLQAYEQIAQSSLSTTNIANPAAVLGASAGQTITIQAGSTTHTFDYYTPMTSLGTFTAVSTSITSGNSMVVTVGSTSYTFTGTGANDLAILNNLAAQINSTGGAYGLTATVNSLGGGNYSLSISPLDVTQSVSIAAGTLNTQLGFTPASLAANPYAFSTLYELAERINETSTSTDPITASVIKNSSGTYQIKIEPVNPASFITFGGTTAAINSPLGTGASTTIYQALGLQNTTSSKQLATVGQPVTINLSNIIQAAPNTITFNFGTVGSSNATSQINQGYVQRLMEQDGAVTGQLDSIEVDREGYIVANFTNGKVRNIYQLAIATFTNQNGLTPVTDTLFSVSKGSGALNLSQAGSNGAGSVLSGMVEGSNVEVANELSNLIQAQTWYQASAKVINVENSLFEELIHRVFT